MDNNENVTFRSIHVSKVNDNPATMELHNNNSHEYRTLSDDEFKHLFTHYGSNFEYTLPDRLVQDLIHDNSIIPSFVESRRYQMKHLDDMLLKANLLTLKKMREMKKERSQSTKPYSRTQKKQRKQKKSTETKKEKYLRLTNSKRSNKNKTKRNERKGKGNKKK